MTDKIVVTGQQFHDAWHAAKAHDSASYMPAFSVVAEELNKILNKRWRAQETHVGNGEFQLTVYTNAETADRGRRVEFAKKLADVLNEQEVTP